MRRVLAERILQDAGDVVEALDLALLLIDVGDDRLAVDVIDLWPDAGERADVREVRRCPRPSSSGAAG